MLSVKIFTSYPSIVFIVESFYIYAAKVDTRCATILRSKANIEVTHFAVQKATFRKYYLLYFLSTKMRHDSSKFAFR